VKKDRGTTNEDKFNTITNETAVDALLIRAMIDKTTHAHEGTTIEIQVAG
jgi:hypothetical protein